MSINEDSISLHKEKKGKIEIRSKVSCANNYDLSVVYTPGVAEPCKIISLNKEEVYEYTGKGNFVAIITDGSRVLGLGNIGAEASLPVMEGKAVLFKVLGGVDAFPICLSTQDPEKIIETVKYISPVFGGINLEDIETPKCFEIENRLIEELDIPVFHDDQYGTAIVTLAALLNGLKLVEKEKEEVNIVISGAGAAGTAVAKFLILAGFKNIILCDRKGAIYEGRKEIKEYQIELSKLTNKNKVKGSLSDIMKDADVFIGLSAPNIITKEMVASMNKDPIIFAMANPIPEILPEEAKKGGARVIGTGRSDYPNQINNVLCFPGIFKGALSVLAKKINNEMKLAAAHAIANLVKQNELSENYILPQGFDLRVAPCVAKAVADAAIKSGVGTKNFD